MWDSWKNTYTFMPGEVHANRSYAYRYEEWLESLSNPDPDHLILTVWNDVTLVGFCSCKRNDDDAIPEARGELHAAYFLKEYRGHAIGVPLLDKMIRFLLKRDLWPACLWAFEQNQVRHLYKAGGFHRKASPGPCHCRHSYSRSRIPNPGRSSGVICNDQPPASRRRRWTASDATCSSCCSSSCCSN